ncbi:bola protein [Podospora fimiseda]|uniref:Bola protein n=1 Tax=Podospora fimiseda TaxID=252190 RepID=A0AAN7GUD1_9PEZI|nr:bola protein [Podospora fimiseda]
MLCRSCMRNRLTQRLSQTAPRRPLSSATTSRLQLQQTSSLLSQTQFLQSTARRALSTSPVRFSTQPQDSPIVPLEKPANLTEGEAQVWDILIAEFSPTQLIVQDISGGCGSMYGIDISSEKFRGLGMLKQQRLVNAALADLVKEWHGVQLKTRAP